MVEDAKLDRRVFLHASLTGISALCWTATVTFPARAATQEAGPKFFTAVEWAFIRAAADRLIPAGAEGPGALELNVPTFIDQQMNLPYGNGSGWYMKGPYNPDAPATLGYQTGLTPREMYRQGIAAVDAWCNDTDKKAFADLTSERQDAVLTALEQGKSPLKNPSGTAFFEQLLANVNEGYFADPLYGGNKGMGSWKMIGFPGARADFTDWMRKPGAYYPYGPVSINDRSGR